MGNVVKRCVRGGMGMLWEGNLDILDKGGMDMGYMWGKVGKVGRE